MRVFQFIVMFLMLALLGTGGYFAYDRSHQSMADSAKTYHANIAHGFLNSVWKMHRSKVMPVLAGAAQEWPDDIDVAVFATDMSSYFSGMSLASVTVYNAKEQFVLSYNPNASKEVPRPTADAVKRANISKRPTTSFLTGPHFTAMVQSVIPITKDGNTEVFIAITNDVSMENIEFVKLLGAIFASVAATMLILFLLNRVSARRAEAIISKQYEENADLIAQTALAKEANQQKSQFLANITHELRTPLNAIIGFSDILKNEFVPAPGQSHHSNYIGDIHSAGTHLLGLINDILDFSKAEAGKLEVEVTEVNAVKTVQNCIRLIMPRAEIAKVMVIDALPKENMVLITDGKKFKQILLNLLSNAVKFTPAGGKVTVSAWHDMKNDSWVFEVRDTGIGIAPKDISRAMSPFGQVDNALSRKFEGTGLGLPLTKKFVEIMGGEFSINSELNKGTTVTFSLPREVKPRDGVIVKQVA